VNDVNRSNFQGELGVKAFHKWKNNYLTYFAMPEEKLQIRLLRWLNS